MTYFAEFVSQISAVLSMCIRGVGKTLIGGGGAQSETMDIIDS